MGVGGYRSAASKDGKTPRKRMEAGEATTRARETHVDDDAPLRKTAPKYNENIKNNINIMVDICLRSSFSYLRRVVASIFVKCGKNKRLNQDRFLTK